MRRTQETNGLSPKESGFHQPAEWAPHTACWLAWPSHGDLWEETLTVAQAEFRALAAAIADVDPETHEPRGESLNVLVPDAETAQVAANALKGLAARTHLISFGDIWLRDTAPLFLKNAEGETATVRFRFNGWGGKYSLPHDGEVSEKIAQKTAFRQFSMPFVLEGGSIDVDGLGTCLTTRQCLLNENRNPGMSQQELEAALNEAIGVTKVLWLGDGLVNDHTDGHVDTIARFAPNNRVICMEARDANDPNKEILEKISSDLEQMANARGEKLEVVRIPSPGPLVDEEGEIMPASYVNFYIGNTTVVVPTYGTQYDEEAVAKIGACFPERRTVGLSAKAILSGGGAFHCISQQQV
jgi:agmatine deiminase